MKSNTTHYKNIIEGKKLICPGPTCRHIWTYKGNADRYTSCPKCHTSVRVNQTKEELQMSPLKELKGIFKQTKKDAKQIVTDIKTDMKDIVSDKPAKKKKKAKK